MRHDMESIRQELTEAFILQVLGRVKMEDYGTHGYHIDRGADTIYL